MLLWNNPKRLRMAFETDKKTTVTCAPDKVRAGSLTHSCS